jgi:hypothetical protein
VVPVSTLTRGLLAGLAGSAFMHGFRFCWENVTYRRSEHALFGFDQEADVNAARVFASLFHYMPSERKAAQLGIGLHYAFGTLLGCLYAAVRKRSDKFETGKPICRGVVLWLYADEIPVALSAISNPFRKSLLSHSGALLAHLVFAFTVENTFQLCEAAPGTSR